MQRQTRCPKPPSFRSSNHKFAPNNQAFRLDFAEHPLDFVPARTTTISCWDRQAAGPVLLEPQHCIATRQNVTTPQEDYITQWFSLSPQRRPPVASKYAVCNQQSFRPPQFDISFAAGGFLPPWWVCLCLSLGGKLFSLVSWRWGRFCFLSGHWSRPTFVSDALFGNTQFCLLSCHWARGLLIYGSVGRPLPHNMQQIIANIPMEPACVPSSHPLKALGRHVCPYVHTHIYIYIYIFLYIKQINKIKK